MISYVHLPSRAAFDRFKAAAPSTPDGVAIGSPAVGVDGTLLIAHPFSARDRTALGTDAAGEGGETRDTKPVDWREPDPPDER